MSTFKVQASNYAGFGGCTTTLQVLVMENYRKNVYNYYNKVYMYLRKTTDRQIGLPFKKTFSSAVYSIFPLGEVFGLLFKMTLCWNICSWTSWSYRGPRLSGVRTSTIAIFKVPGLVISKSFIIHFFITIHISIFTY